MINFIMIVIVIFNIISIVIVIIVIVLIITVLVFFHLRFLAIQTRTSHRSSKGNLSEMYLLFTMLEVQELIKENFSKTSCHVFFWIVYHFLVNLEDSNHWNLNKLAMYSRISMYSVFSMYYVFDFYMKRKSFRNVL